MRALRRVLTSAVKAYAAKTEAGNGEFAPFEAGEVTATETVVTACAMIRARISTCSTSRCGSSARWPDLYRRKYDERSHGRRNSELADGDYRIVAVGDLEVGIFRLGERLVAYENRCPHYGGPVCQAELFNGVEEIIMPDQTSRGLRFTKDRHVVCPGTVMNSISTRSPSR